MHELIQRPLTVDTLDSIWSLDRRESIDGFYRWHDGALELTATECGVAGWPPGEAAHSTPRLKQSLADGGWAMGWFSGKQLAAAVVVAPYPLCGVLNLRQLQFLHVGRDWRGRGVGTCNVDPGAATTALVGR
ncbi:hypothetical protein [Chitinolyticbacter meiyuanensis]|uniref:hypothetical protein n=1 Tax=Chitinolyticbacter meiyuanensis TaxID=682798 RepID=UPI001C9E41D3|nr:hypothetical protein [Chitinolyticbacter meiyuanensis]